jgi:hypothetical protein
VELWSLGFGKADFGTVIGELSPGGETGPELSRYSSEPCITWDLLNNDNYLCPAGDQIQNLHLKMFLGRFYDEKLVGIHFCSSPGGAITLSCSSFLQFTWALRLERILPQVFPWRTKLMTLKRTDVL